MHMPTASSPAALQLDVEQPMFLPLQNNSRYLTSIPATLPSAGAQAHELNWRADPLDLRLGDLGQDPESASEDDADLAQMTGAKKKKKSRGRINFDRAVEAVQKFPAPCILRVSGLLKFGEDAVTYLGAYLRQFGDVSLIEPVTCSLGGREEPSGIAFVAMRRAMDVVKILKEKEHFMPQGRIAIRKFAMAGGRSKRGQQGSDTSRKPAPSPAAGATSPPPISSANYLGCSAALTDHLVASFNGVSIWRF